MSKNVPGSLSLDRINHKTMAEVVEVKLLEFLRQQSLKPGDALPSELALSEALGVSRNIVREALSRIRMLGMIESKKRRGMVLASPDILGTMERVLNPLMIDDQTLQDIFEMRLTLEMGLADILYIRRKKEDIDELEQIALQNSIPNGPHKFRIKNEIEFHGKIYQMTGNQTIQRFQTMLLPVFGYILKKDPMIQKGGVTHIGLVELLRNGSCEEFRMGMKSHLEHHFARIQ